MPYSKISQQQASIGKLPKVNLLRKGPATPTLSDDLDIPEDEEESPPKKRRAVQPRQSQAQASQNTKIGRGRPPKARTIAKAITQTDADYKASAGQMKSASVRSTRRSARLTKTQTQSSQPRPAMKMPARPRLTNDNNHQAGIRNGVSKSRKAPIKPSMKSSLGSSQDRPITVEDSPEQESSVEEEEEAEDEEEEEEEEEGEEEDDMAEQQVPQSATNPSLKRRPQTREEPSHQTLPSETSTTHNYAGGAGGQSVAATQHEHRPSNDVQSFLSNMLPESSRKEFAQKSKSRENKGARTASGSSQTVDKNGSPLLRQPDLKQPSSRVNKKTQVETWDDNSHKLLDIDDTAWITSPHQDVKSHGEDNRASGVTQEVKPAQRQSVRPSHTAQDKTHVVQGGSHTTQGAPLHSPPAHGTGKESQPKDGAFPTHSLKKRQIPKQHTTPRPTDMVDLQPVEPAERQGEAAKNVRPLKNTPKGVKAPQLSRQTFPSIFTVPDQQMLPSPDQTGQLAHAPQKDCIEAVAIRPMIPIFQSMSANQEPQKLLPHDAQQQPAAKSTIEAPGIVKRPNVTTHLGCQEQPQKRPRTDQEGTNLSHQIEISKKSVDAISKSPAKRVIFQGEITGSGISAQPFDDAVISTRGSKSLDRTQITSHLLGTTTFPNSDTTGSYQTNEIPGQDHLANWVAPVERNEAAAPESPPNVNLRETAKAVMETSEVPSKSNSHQRTTKSGSRRSIHSRTRSDRNDYPEVRSKIHSDSDDDSSDSSDPSESGSTTLVEEDQRQWLENLPPHQKSVYEKLTQVSEELTRNLISREEAIYAIVKKFQRDGSELIDAMHKDQNNAVMVYEQVAISARERVASALTSVLKEVSGNAALGGQVQNRQAKVAPATEQAKGKVSALLKAYT